MNRKFMNFAAVGIGVLGLAGLNSCLKVDETYDLEKDFDMTITVGGDLSVPGSSTEKIKLGDLLDLEEDGIIKANESTGEYHLVQDGEKTSTQVNVPGVDITMTDGFTGAKSQDVNVPGGVSGNKNISIDEKITINVSEGGIKSEIKELKDAVTSCEETYIVFSKTGDNINAVINDGYKIEFPEYITVKSENANWTGENNVLTLNNPDGLEITENTKVKFQITKVDFVKDDVLFKYADNDQSKITLGGAITLDGDITAKSISTTGGNVSIGVGFNRSPNFCNTDKSKSCSC